MKKRRDENIEKGKSTDKVARVIYKTSLSAKVSAQVCIGISAKLRTTLKKLLPNSLTERIIKKKFNI